MNIEIKILIGIGLLLITGIVIVSIIKAVKKHKLKMSDPTRKMTEQRIKDIDHQLREAQFEINRICKESNVAPKKHCKK